jgi:hypothetical protein
MTLGPAGLYPAASRSFNGPPVKRGEVAADVRGQALLIHRGAYFPRDRAQNDTMKSVIPGAGADLQHRSPRPRETAPDLERSTPERDRIRLLRISTQ